MRWADSDKHNSYVDGEVQKCLVLAGWENFRAVNHPDTVIEPVEQPWIARIKKHIPDSADPVQRSQVADLEIRMLMRQSKFSEGLEMARKCLEDLDKISAVHPLTRANAYLRAAIQANLTVMHTFKGAQPLSPEATNSGMRLLWSALDLGAKALALYRKTDGAEPLFECTSFVWGLLSVLVGTMEDSKSKALLEIFADELSLTEKICDDMRRSVVPIGGLKSLMNKRLLVSKKRASSFTTLV